MKKRTKQILAITAAATMAFGSSLTAFAADSTLPNDSTVTGGGDLEYVDTSKVYEVTLPTSGALDFVIDPQGLTSLGNGQSANLEDLLANSSIVSKEGAGAYIKNESSVGVKVTVKMNITDDSDEGKKVTPVATLDAVTADDKTNICLLAIPSTNSPSAIADYTASTQGIVIESIDDTAATEFSFVLDKAVYTVKKDAEGALSYAKDASVENNYDAVAFKLGGKANGKADWSAYTGASKKVVGVNAVFSVADAAETDVVKDGYTAHGLMDLGSVKEVAVAPPAPPAPADVAPSITNTTVTFSKENGAVVNVDLGSGTKKATGIATVQVQKDDGTVANPWATTCYSLSEGKLTLNTTAGIAGLEVGATRKLKVTFDDADKTAVVLNVTIAE